MKVKTVIAVGLLSFTAYKAYQKRCTIKELLSISRQAKDVAQLDLDNIKANLDLIHSQGKVIQNISRDLAHKWRYFNQETQAHLTEIQNRMAKYQENSELISSESPTCQTVILTNNHSR
ncbi:TPA: chemotaxis protein [Streptococcus pyogenes]|uniref:chemotaxis protein n=1 Tax=Streptococcus pyogenes TaxID=1314 RepID=UPI00109C8C66|nr:chemotaxis protein [Streptococcus pyogenes]VHE46908.1 COG0840: methyl-accepting chemotaxis protein [Streptococcus pyogenes]